MKDKLFRVWAYVRHRLLATRNGHGVHSPFAWQLCEEVFYNRHPFYDFARLDSIRKSLENDTGVLEVEDHGAGSTKFRSSKRRVSDIARFGISSGRQSEILYRLVNLLRPAGVIELGTSLGMNALYLGRANPAASVTTIEGSPSLANFAHSLCARYAPNVRVVNGLFDNVLPSVLRQQNPSLVYIDGNHRYDATIRYFMMMMEVVDPQTVIVLDDIYWSRGMAKAWNEMRKHPKVTLSIDAFSMGFLFFRNEVKHPLHLRLRL